MLDPSLQQQYVQLIQHELVIYTDDVARVSTGATLFMAILTVFALR